MTIAPTLDTPIRIREARDLLAAVPYLLGYQPSECVLVVCVHPGGSLGLIARTALADLATAKARASSADLVARRAREDGTSFAYVVTFTTGTQSGAATAAFALALTTQDIPSESWLVDATSYRNLSCHDDGCCPARGYPLAALAHSEVGAELQAGAATPAPSRDAAYRIRGAEPVLRDQARRSARHWAADGERARALGKAEWFAWRREGFALWHQAVAATTRGVAVPASVGGRLACALSDRRVRDAVLLSALPGGEPVARRMLAEPTGTDDLTSKVGDVLSALITAEAPVAPSYPELAVLSGALEAVVAQCPRRLRPAPLTILALLAWWQGDGGRASYRLAEARRIDADYPLAHLVSGLVEAGIPPGWTRNAAHQRKGEPKPVAAPPH